MQLHKGRTIVPIVIVVGCIALLLFLGVPLIMASYASAWNARNDSRNIGRIISAVNVSDVSTVQQLLSRDPSVVDARTPTLRQTPLHLAAKKGDATMAGILITGGADIDARDTCGQSPLHIAVQERSDDVVSLLVASGADVTIPSDYGTPIELAVALGEMPILQTMLQSADGRHYLDGNVDSLLRFASITGQTEMAKYLINKNADVNGRGGEGMTALHYAKTPEMALLLLRHGANRNVVSNDGHTPEGFAEEMRRDDVADAIRNYDESKRVLQ